MLDLHDLYSDKHFLDSLADDISRLFVTHLKSLNPVQVVSFFFQLDSIVDHILSAKDVKEKDVRVQKLLKMRGDMLEKVKLTFPYYWSIEDIIVQCPSYTIAKHKSAQENSQAYPGLKQGFSITNFLNEVSSLKSLSNVILFDALHLKFAAIALSASRLEDPAVPMSEVQAWIMAFLDNSFWMSTARVGHCLAAMIRAGRLTDVIALQYHFLLDSWGAAKSLPTNTTLPSFLKCDCTAQHKVSNSFLHFFIKGSEAHNLYSKYLNNNADLTQGFPEHLTLADIFCSDKIKELILKASFHFRKDESKTIANFPKFVHTTLLQAPHDSVYCSDNLPQFLSIFKPQYSFMLPKVSPKNYPHMIYNLAILATRNFRSHALVATKLFVPKYREFSAADKEIFLSTVFTQDTLIAFLFICNTLGTLTNVDATFMITITSLGFFDSLGKFTNHAEILQCFLVEYIISSNIVAQTNIPNEFLTIRSTSSFSRYVGGLRGIKSVFSLQHVKSFLAIAEVQTCDHALAVILIALLPMIVDSEESCKEYLDLIPLDVKLTGTITRTFQIIAGFLHQHANPKFFNHPFFAKIIKKFEVEQLSALSSTAKRRCLQHYSIQNKLCMPLIQVSKNIELDESARLYLRDYMKSSEKFDVNRMAEGIAALIISNLKGNRSDVFIPVNIAEAVCCGRPNSEDSFYELTWRIHCILSHHINFSYLSSEQQSRLKAMIGSKELSDAQFKHDYLLKFPSEQQIEEEISTPKSKKGNKINTKQNKKKDKSSKPDLNSKKESSKAKAPLEVQNNGSTASISEKTNTEQLQSNSSNNSSNGNSSMQQQPNAPGGTGTLTTGSTSTATNPVQAKPANSPPAPVPVPAEDFDGTKCKFTFDFINSNCILLDNGLVLPKQYPPDHQFKKCLTFYLQEGHGLPFKLPQEFFNYITTGKGFAEYSNGKSDWSKLSNISKNMSCMSIWKPKVKPMSVQFENQSLSASVELRDFLLSLDSLDLARLQSLIYYSTGTGKTGKKGQIVITVALDRSRQTCAIKSGLIVISQFKDKELLKKQITELLENDYTFEEKKVRYNDSRKEKNENSDKSKELNDNESKKPKRAKAIDGKPQPQKRPKLDVATSSKQPTSAQTTTTTTTTTTLTTTTQTTPEADFQFITNSKSAKDTESTVPQWKVEKNLEMQPINNPLIYRETVKLEFLYTKFEIIVNKIYPHNFESCFNRLDYLLKNNLVEYIALDCEMTGLYTFNDDERHSRDIGTLYKNNTKQLKEGAKVNSVFQLGIVMKTRQGGWSIWSFYTAPHLTKESFITSTFKFLFEDPLKEQNPSLSSEKVASMISAKLQTISSSSISQQQLASLSGLLLSSSAPFIVFSGYADMLHLFKAVGRNIDGLNHKDIQAQLRDRIYDLKSVCLSAFINGLKQRSLSAFFLSFYPDLEENNSSLHNASFDAVLTAMLYEALKANHSEVLRTKNGLFNFGSASKQTHTQ